METENNQVNIKTHNVQEINIYLPFHIGEPEDFIDIFTTLRTATPNDVINIHINCSGGYCVTGVQLINEMISCKGKVISILNGMAASMATFILLAGHEIEIYPDSEFMIHFVSSGTYGKGHEMKAHIDFLDRHYKKLYRKHYRFFLTSQEITEVINGKDMWMDSDEVISRLESRAKKMEALEKKSKTKE
jgi:ATP-dependent Clp protease, protease subunit